MDRDLIGYGANPPNPNWPGAARLAVNFVLNFEEGSEPSIGDGDPASEWGLTEYGGTNPAVVGRDLAAEGMFAYGARVGFWRVMRLFAERDLPMTIFGCALALERNPPAAAAIAAAGHDICCHGWRWEKHFEMDEATERERIARAVASIRKTMGERPLGWYCRSGPSVNTRRLLVEEGGFLYDSDAYDDELPYWTTVAGKPHLVVPYTSVDQRLEVRPRHVRDRATTSSFTAAMRSISCTGRARRSRKCCRSACTCASSAIRLGRRGWSDCSITSGATVMSG